MIRIAFAAAALLAAATAVRADDLANLGACLQGADDHGTHPLTCIGTVYTPCLDSAAGRDYRDEATCVADELAVWDALLNQEWKTLLGVLTPEEKDLVRGAQRAWIAFRDADCDAVLGLAHPARGALWGNDCLLQRTAERVLALRATISDRGQ